MYIYIGEDRKCPLAEAFCACNGAFSVKSHASKESDCRRIWLFTNDDNPNKNYPTEQVIFRYLERCLNRVHIYSSVYI
jgi:hypothetical protein